MSKVSVVCPHCSTEMIQGRLRCAKEVIYITSPQSLRGSTLQALICPACRHVELRAVHPEDLTRHDFSEEELDALFGDDSEVRLE